MSTEKELMKLLADYGKECISAGIAEMSLSDALKQRMAEDVRTAHVALTDRLRALLTELESAREDAARYRWLRENWFTMTSNYQRRITFKVGEPRWSDITEEELDAAIDAARKQGDA